ncbi:MAG: PQQ-binding-like beta-propeller repeat protein [Acidobacteria bacterium]|nr:PQQ-binding-like beta-propeller repeat protein [Acidobacteriota bacterium]
MMSLILTASAILAFIAPAVAQVKNYKPVTQEMLLNPSPDDWLMISRTYDQQRYSPLKQINRQNVSQLRMAWSRGFSSGVQETVPLVHDGVMYVVAPGPVVQALDAANGDLIWEYRRKLPDDMRSFIGDAGRTKCLAIFEDLIFYTAEDGYIVALGAKTGDLRWETKVQDYKQRTQHTSGPIVVEGKVISSRACETREGCFILALDAMTGKEAWKFYVTPAEGEQHGDSWGSVPTEKRVAGSWGLPGSYDPVKRMIYWGVANPKPFTRLRRHNGNVDAVPRFAPADLYSNSTIALDSESGKLKWYYQHLPGDDWDQDYPHERVLVRTALNPDPASVKWINPKIKSGEQRDVAVMVGEGGGAFVLDRNTGEFLWATPFPYDTPDFLISKVDVETGKTYINWDKVFKKNGDRSLLCSFNTKSYWPMAYHPGTNSIYVPYTDACLDMTANEKSPQGSGPRFGLPRPGSDPNKFAGIAKINLSTGKMQRIYEAQMPGNGAMLATAGNLVFWGDLDRRFRAFDAETGKILWQAIIGGVTQMSTITYAVNGKQYVAVIASEGRSGTSGLLSMAKGLKIPRNFNALYVFALP